MHGIGDTIYARPFVKLLVSEGHEIYIDTPLQFIFSDLRVNFIKPSRTSLRCQEKHLTDHEPTYVEQPAKVDKTIDFFYTHQDIKRHGIVTHMEQAFGFQPGSTIPIFDLPLLQCHDVKLPFNKKVAIIRPVTHRQEWLCTSRSPRPNYIAWCSKILKDMGYYVISIADCDGDKEWIEPDGEPVADLKLHQGELGIERTLSLMKNANLVVGGSGFIIPASVAVNTNLFIIFGGRGAYDNPHKLLDLRMNLKKIGWALPDNFCRCKAMNHGCDKTISDLDSQLFKFIKETQ